LCDTFPDQLLEQGMRWSVPLIAMAAASSASQSAAGSPSTPPVAPHVWQLDWQDNRCLISTGDLSTGGLSVSLTPGVPYAEMFFIGLDRALPSVDGDKVTITLVPGGERFTVTVMKIPTRSGAKALRTLKLGVNFPSAFAKSSAIEVAGLKQPLSVPIVGASKAVAALRDCVDAKLGEWGIDAKAYEELLVPPTDPSEHLWFKYSDYPAGALAALESGDVIARVDVDATGKVTGCAVVASSGSRSLDNATCSRSLESGRFFPAVGADGKPAAAVRTIRVVWRLETEGG
jgi:TonB family protein